MNADSQLLRKTIDLLKRIRSETHGRGDDSVIRQLNEIILDLEAEYAKGKGSIDAKKVLELLGKFVVALPVFAKLIRKLVEMMGE